MPADLAPERCVVCNKPFPPADQRTPASGWIYISGATPAGAMACSSKCGDVAIVRYRLTGRVDLPERDKVDPTTACRCLSWPCTCACHRRSSPAPIAHEPDRFPAQRSS